MKKTRIQEKVNKKNCLGSLLAIVALLFFAGNCFAANFKSIVIFPQHVGVFTTDGKQQFVAFGIDEKGEYVNITKQVTWEITKELEYENGDPIASRNLVSIDENGLATINAGVKGGQVRVTATYPKIGKVTAPMQLLLNKEKR